ncbi:MAG: sulfite exporter TauE/SafE family protein [Candidatus Ranarchaeia archaeon]
MDPIIILVFLCIGLTAGLMSGIFGIGGGSVRIPLLTLAGLPLIYAFGINLFTIPFSSSIGAYTHRQNIDRKIGVWVVIGGTLGSLTGAFLVGLIPNIVLAFIFLITAIITVILIHLGRIAPAFSEKITPGRAHFIGFAYLLNLITGMRGGSGGSLFPPFLRAMRLDINKAIATSLFVTVFTALFALAVYWYRGNIELVSGVVVLIGSMLGARGGSKLSLKAKPEWLEISLSVLIIILACLTVYKAL